MKPMVSDAGPILRMDDESRPRDSHGDPFAQVLALDEKSAQRLSASTVISVLAYAALIAQATLFSTELRGFAEAVHQAALRAHPYELQIEEPPPPPPPPEPEPEPEAKAPEPAPAPPPPKAATPAPATPAPPPAAAEAGKVLAQDPDPDEPVDLTGNTFVQGTGDSYAGGVTSSTGTSKTAVRDKGAIGSAAGTGSGSPNGVPGGTGPDLSSAARPSSGSWDHCGFPAEADIEQINNAKVSIAVTVTAEGKATSVSVTGDPGYGFGALAKRCALRERFIPAKGRTGQAITATQMIVINFRR